MVAMRPPGRGITEPGGQAGLAEQARRLLHEFAEIPECHQAMHENRAPEGKMVALVGAPKAGLKDLPL